jgi:hypothetical protein
MKATVTVLVVSGCLLFAQAPQLPAPVRLTAQEDHQEDDGSPAYYGAPPGVSGNAQAPMQRITMSPRPLPQGLPIAMIRRFHGDFTYPGVAS